LNEDDEMLKADPNGPYHDLCEFVCAVTNASGTLLLVCEGDRGSGASFLALSPLAVRVMPAALRKLADAIEQSAPFSDAAVH
jgi:hypothetical protein